MATKAEKKSLLRKEIIDAAKEEAARIVAEAKEKFGSLQETINIRLGLIPKKEIYDTRQEARALLQNCADYLTDEMKDAINHFDIDRLNDLVSKMVHQNRYGYHGEYKEPGYDKLRDFADKFGEYIKKRDKNISTEEILKKLKNTERQHTEEQPAARRKRHGR